MWEHEDIDSKQLQPPSNLPWVLLLLCFSAVDSTEEGQAYGTLHFFFDAVLPFLEVFYKKGYGQSQSEVANALANELIVSCHLWRDHIIAAAMETSDHMYGLKLWLTTHKKHSNFNSYTYFKNE